MKFTESFFGGKDKSDDKGEGRENPDQENRNLGGSFIAVPSSPEEGEDLEGVDENEQMFTMEIKIGKLKAKKERVGLDRFESEDLDFLENKLANIKESRLRRLKRGG